MEQKYPNTVPLSGGLKVVFVIFFCITAIMLYGIFFMLTNPIYMEDGNEEMPLYFKALFLVIAAAVTVGGIKLMLDLALRILQKRGAMTLSEDGVHDTMVYLRFLAFYTVLRVKFIPWDVLTHDKADDPTVYQIDPNGIDRVRAGRIARHLLKNGGFNIFVGKISPDEFEQYRVK